MYLFNSSEFCIHSAPDHIYLTSIQVMVTKQNIKGEKKLPINTDKCHERTNVENFLNKIRVFGIIWIKIKGVMVFSSPELKAQLSFSECLFVHASV